MTTNFTIIAKLYLAWSLCALPASKEKKTPTVQWKAYQDTLPTESQWDEWGKNATAIGFFLMYTKSIEIKNQFSDKISSDKSCPLNIWIQNRTMNYLTRLLR
jgi:hypothetical protein